jgi:hypothetical protein
VKSAFKLAAVLCAVLVSLGCSKTDTKLVAVDDLTIQCAAGLRAIDAVKLHWAQQTGAATNAVPTMDDLAPLFRHEPPVCPAGGTYTLGNASELPSCSIAAHNDYFKKQQEQAPPQ